jgi:hypothetical protein
VWTRAGRELRFLAVRHYAIVEAFDAGPAGAGGRDGGTDFINAILAGPKFVQQDEFEKLCRVLGKASQVIAASVAPGAELYVELVSGLVARYGVSLVRERAVVLIDAVGFSLRSPLEQVAMQNSLSYSVNSAHSQLLSKDVHIDFARTTTGDGFYIWNRDKSAGANIALYQLMMLILTDNAVAQRKAKRFPVPRLRAAFHVGEYYEFFQVEALNPTTFGYVVGQVTIELSRILEQALPGQILLGEFDLDMNDARTGKRIRCSTLDFIEQTAATLDQIRGLAVANDNIEDIRCYLTGEAAPGGRFLVSHYPIRDKHGLSRTVYNAKINLHLLQGEPIFLGVRHAELHPPGAAAWPERK